MSVVLVTPDRYDTIRKTMQHLQRQTVRDRLQIVIVAPSAKRLNLDESALKEFCCFRIVEVGEIKALGQAWAAGVREAIYRAGKHRELLAGIMPAAFFG